MDDNFKLIGNPYLSAIRFTDFMAASTDLEGPMRVWTHGTLPSNANGNPFYGSFTYNYSSSDYLVFNFTKIKSLKRPPFTCQSFFQKLQNSDYQLWRALPKPGQFP